MKKTVLITAGAKRLGRHIADKLVGEGWSIALHYNSSKTQAEETAHFLSKKGGKIQIRYLEGINFSKNILEKIKNKIYERAEEDFPLYFSNVEKIKPSPSGKPQIIVRAY